MFYECKEINVFFLLWNPHANTFHDTLNPFLVACMRSLSDASVPRKMRTVMEADINNDNCPNHKRSSKVASVHINTHASVAAAAEQRQHQLQPQHGQQRFIFFAVIKFYNQPFRFSVCFSPLHKMNRNDFFKRINNIFLRRLIHLKKEEKSDIKCCKYYCSHGGIESEHQMWAKKSRKSACVRSNFSS